MRTQNPELDFVGIGFSRCGTTWIAKCLDEHPEIFIPPQKELHYYNNRDRMAQESLASFFPDEHGGEKLGEFTPRYIIDKTAMEHIAEAHPNATIIVALRDPVERAFSQYKYFRYNLEKEEIDDFETALEGPYREDYVTKSEYADHLSNAFEIFGRGQVHLVFNTDLHTDPASVIGDLYTDIGLDDSFDPPSLKTRLNESGPEVGGVLGTDLQGDEVMISGKRIQMFDRMQSYGTALTNALRIRRIVQPVVSPLFHSTQRFVQRKAGQVASTDPRETENPPSITESTKRRVYGEYFAKQVERLETMIAKDLSHWKH